MKNIEEYRQELDELISYYNYDLKNEDVVKKSLETENKIYELFKEA